MSAEVKPVAQHVAHRSSGLSSHFFRLRWPRSRCRRSTTIQTEAGDRRAQTSPSSSNSRTSPTRRTRNLTSLAASPTGTSSRVTTARLRSAAYPPVREGAEAGAEAAAKVHRLSVLARRARSRTSMSRTKRTSRSSTIAVVLCGGLAKVVAAGAWGAAVVHTVLVVALAGAPAEEVSVDAAVKAEVASVGGDEDGETGRRSVAHTSNVQNHL
jgi:hypothetical protein